MKGAERSFYIWFDCAKINKKSLKTLKQIGIPWRWATPPRTFSFPLIPVFEHFHFQTFVLSISKVNTHAHIWNPFIYKRILSLFFFPNYPFMKPLSPWSSLLDIYFSEQFPHFALIEMILFRPHYRVAPLSPKARLIAFVCRVNFGLVQRQILSFFLFFWR